MSSRAGPARSRAPLIALGCAAAATILALLVHAGATQALDDRVREVFRPEDVWGPAQVRVDVVVEGLRPVVTTLLAVLVTLGAALAGRSWRPIVLGGAAVGTTVVVVLGTKLLTARPDPHGETHGLGDGSFPSGHVAALLMCAGLVVVLLDERGRRGGGRWWAWAAVTLLGATMALSLLLQAAHWATDILGGALIATTALALTVSIQRRSPPRRLTASTGSGSPSSSGAPGPRARR